MGAHLGKVLLDKPYWAKKFKLNNKTILIDGNNIIWKAAFRGLDNNNQLKQVNGVTTGHLNPLIDIIRQFHKQGANITMVWDGKPRQEKKQTIKKRKAYREKNQERKTELKETLKKPDLKPEEKAEQKENLKLLNKRTFRVTPEMIETAKEVTAALGVKHIDAPHDADQLAGQLCGHGLAVFVITDDRDTLLFGANKILRTGTNGKYVLCTLQNEEKLNRNQLQNYTLLTGNDYNKAIPGLDPDQVLNLVKKQPNFIRYLIDLERRGPTTKLEKKILQYLPPETALLTKNIYQEPQVLPEHLTILKESTGPQPEKFEEIATKYGITKEKMENAS